MSKGDEDFDLSHAEDKNGKNGAKSTKRPGRPKGAPSRKRKRDLESQPEDNTQTKRIKSNNTTNLPEEGDAEFQQNAVVAQRNQQLLQEYNNMRNIFEEERVNQQSHLYLRRIAHDKSHQFPHLAKYPLLQYLWNACKIMMLNEYEIVAWALWIDSIPLEDDEYTIEEKTLFTALFVKISLSTNKRLEEIFEAYFQLNLDFNHEGANAKAGVGGHMTGFIDKFNNWIEKNSQTFQPHPVEMNQKYTELSRPYNPKMEQDFVEYNHIVDEILQISPPYQNDSPFAPKYLASEHKPVDVDQQSELAHVSQPRGFQKIMIKRNPDRADLVPGNEFSKNSYGYPGILPEYKHSNSFDSLREGMNSFKNIEMNKQNQKGIANLISSLQNIYNMEGDDAPHQPPSFKTDSLFKNNGNSNNPFMNKPDVLKGNSLLEFRHVPSGLSNRSFGMLDQKSSNVDKSPGGDMNKAYIFLKNKFANPGGYVKLNLGDIQKDDDDFEAYENMGNPDNLNWGNSATNIIRSESNIPFLRNDSNPMKKNS